MRMGAEGIKIQISGRLNGARNETVLKMYKEGRTPLHTFRADIDYCHAEALTKVGLLGIKVWICRGEVFVRRSWLELYAKQGKWSWKQWRKQWRKELQRKKNNR